MNYIQIIEYLKKGACLIHTIPNHEDEQHYFDLKQDNHYTTIKKKQFDDLRLHCHYDGCVNNDQFIYKLKY